MNKCMLLVTLSIQSNLLYLGLCNAGPNHVCTAKPKYLLLSNTLYMPKNTEAKFKIYLS